MFLNNWPGGLGGSAKGPGGTVRIKGKGSAKGGENRNPIRKGRTLPEERKGNTSDALKKDYYQKRGGHFGFEGERSQQQNTGEGSAEYKWHIQLLVVIGGIMRRKRHSSGIFRKKRPFGCRGGIKKGRVKHFGEGGIDTVTLYQLRGISGGGTDSGRGIIAKIDKKVRVLFRFFLGKRMYCEKGKTGPFLTYSYEKRYSTSLTDRWEIDRKCFLERSLLKRRGKKGKKGVEKIAREKKWGRKFP